KQGGRLSMQVPADHGDPLICARGRPNVEAMWRVLWLVAESTGCAGSRPDSPPLPNGDHPARSSCVASRTNFAIETTLASNMYARRIRTWRSHGYVIALHFIERPSADYAVE